MQSLQCLLLFLHLLAVFLSGKTVLIKFASDYNKFLECQSV